jgi:hypothetical protein
MVYEPQLLDGISKPFLFILFIFNIFLAFILVFLFFFNACFVFPVFLDSLLNLL